MVRPSEELRRMGKMEDTTSSILPYTKSESASESGTALPKGRSTVIHDAKIDTSIKMWRTYLRT